MDQDIDLGKEWRYKRTQTASLRERPLTIKILCIAQTQWNSYIFYELCLGCESKGLAKRYFKQNTHTCKSGGDPKGRILSKLLQRLLKHFIRYDLSFRESGHSESYAKKPLVLGKPFVVREIFKILQFFRHFFFNLSKILVNVEFIPINLIVFKAPPVQI